jgi:hypothetical protein
MNRQPSAESTNCAHGAVDRRGEGRVDSSAAANKPDLAETLEHMRTALASND